MLPQQTSEDMEFKILGNPVLIQVPALHISTYMLEFVKFYSPLVIMYMLA